ncbi:hypothetical protein DS885_13850 [Psychromonas sp. B3M02]|nr:hypothetical protein DS885_13850 [Psychromonas sp. B3M02]
MLILSGRDPNEFEKVELDDEKSERISSYLNVEPILNLAPCLKDAFLEWLDSIIEYFPNSLLQKISIYSNKEINKIDNTPLLRYLLKNSKYQRIVLEYFANNSFKLLDDFLSNRAKKVIMYNGVFHKKNLAGEAYMLASSDCQRCSMRCN